MEIVAKKQKHIKEYIWKENQKSVDLDFAGKRSKPKAVTERSTA